MRIKGILFFILCAFLFVTVSVKYLLPAAASFLLVKNHLKPADVIVVLGGDDDRRVKQAVALYQQGVSKFMIMSGADNDGSTRMVHYMKRDAVNAGVPADKILIEPKAQHTYQHPIFVKPIMVAHGFRSAIVVSSPYHMRRVDMRTVILNWIPGGRTSMPARRCSRNIPRWRLISGARGSMILFARC